MFAVIKTGGKQYKVAKDDTIRVEKLEGNVGDVVALTDVLAVGNKVGAPLVSGAGVAAEIVAQGKADKVLIFKKVRRQTYRRKQGHRQTFTELKVVDIKASGFKVEDVAKKAKAKPAAKKADVKEEPKAKAPAKKAERTKTASKPAAKKMEAKAPAKKVASKPAAKKADAKPAVKKAPAKKPAAKKPAAKKAEEK
jgi:large subunit ribosomal protein L21